MRIIYVTTSNSGEAKKIANRLLEKKLIACANIFPIESMYWWDNDIQEDIEFALILKTSEDKFEEVEKEIKKIHTYEVPAIFSWLPDRVSKEYEKWLKENVSE